MLLSVVQSSHTSGSSCGCGGDPEGTVVRFGREELVVEATGDRLPLAGFHKSLDSVLRSTQKLLPGASYQLPAAEKGYEFVAISSDPCARLLVWEEDALYAQTQYSLRYLTHLRITSQDLTASPLGTSEIRVDLVLEPDSTLGFLRVDPLQYTGTLSLSPDEAGVYRTDGLLFLGAEEVALELSLTVEFDALTGKLSASLHGGRLVGSLRTETPFLHTFTISSAAHFSPGDPIEFLVAGALLVSDVKRFRTMEGTFILPLTEATKGRVVITNPGPLPLEVSFLLGTVQKTVAPIAPIAPIGQPRPGPAVFLVGPPYQTAAFGNSEGGFVGPIEMKAGDGPFLPYTGPTPVSTETIPAGYYLFRFAATDGAPASQEIPSLEMLRQPAPPAVEFDVDTRLLTAGQPGDDLEYFDPNVGNWSSYPVGGVQVDPYSHPADEYRFRARANATQAQGLEAGSPRIPGPPPLISGISNQTGLINQYVYIYGSMFGYGPNAFPVNLADPLAIVTFSGANGSRVTANVSYWSQTYLQVQVPVGAVTGTVRVETQDGNSEFYSTQSFTIILPPGAVENFQIASGDNGYASLTWDPTENLSDGGYYVVEYAAPPYYGTYRVITYVYYPNHSVDISPILNNTFINFRVTAYNSYGNSGAASETVGFNFPAGVFDSSLAVGSGGQAAQTGSGSIILNGSPGVVLSYNGGDVSPAFNYYVYIYDSQNILVAMMQFPFSIQGTSFAIDYNGRRYETARLQGYGSDLQPLRFQNYAYYFLID